jgi:hypothetical protein
MLHRLLMSAAIAVAPVLLAAPGAAQQPGDCPAVEAGRGTPVEVRVGDMVLRAQISSEADQSGEGTRVEGRLIGCERDPRIPPPADDTPAPAAGAEHDGLGSVLRLLHDLRVGFELGPVQDGRCVRAQIDVTDSAGGVPVATRERPLAVELCGLSFDRGPGAPDAP